MANIKSDAIDNGPEEELDLTPVEDTEPVEASTEQETTDETPVEEAPKGARAAAARALAGDIEKPAAVEEPAKPKLQPGQEIDPISGRVLDPIKAPASMTPELREQWSTVPRRMQQYWSDREKHIATELGRTAEARKFHDEFRSMTAPYEATLKQYGITATQHAKELFNLSHQITVGTPQQRAAIFVQMLKQYQPDAATMQAMLEGQNVSVQPFTEPKVQLSDDELADRALAKREASALEDDATAAMAQFEQDPANEFYGDLKSTMGKLIDSGVIAGPDMATMLRQAYDLAAAQHPGIQDVLKARAAAQAAAAPVIAPTSPKTAPTSAQISRPTPSVKPSVGGGVQRTQQTRFKSARDAARAAIEADFPD